MSGKRPWIQRHVKDQFVKQAQRDGYVSRAAYKLLQMHEKKQIFRRGMVVCDLGAAPGGWSQVASELVGSSGRVVAVDLLPLTVSLPNFTHIQGDIFSNETLQEMLKLVPGGVDVVMSDMSPDLTGHKTVDQPRSMALVEEAWYFASLCLKKRPSSVFVSKVFQGAGVDEFRQILMQFFQRVSWQKPDASRAESKEGYVLAQGYKLID